MPSFVDHTGRRIGRVQIIENIERGINSRWLCLCDCGSMFKCLSRSFIRGDTFECHECRYERRRGIDLTGRKFGRWTVIKREIDQNNKTVWHCICDCGVEGRVAGNVLGKRGRSMSCGCLGRKEKSKHANTTLYPPAHGLSTSNFYHTRTAIIHKCHNENWKTYSKFGGQGISVCDLWRNGAKDMHDWALSNGWQKSDVVVLKSGCREFSPENCLVISKSEFFSNVGHSQGFQITYDNETHSVSKWARLLDVKPSCLMSKLKKNPSVDEVFNSHFRKCKFVRDPSLTKKVVDMYLEGKTQAEIAKIIGVKPPTIKYHLIKENITIREEDRKRLKKPHITNKSIIELYNQGVSCLEIQKKLGLSNTCVAKRLKKLGIYKNN